MYIPYSLIKVHFMAVYIKPKKPGIMPCALRYRKPGQEQYRRDLSVSRQCWGHWLSGQTACLLESLRTMSQVNRK